MNYSSPCAAQNDTHRPRFAYNLAMSAFEDRPKRDKQVLIRRTADA